MSGQNATRESDEMALYCVQMRCAGYNNAAIGETIGKSPQFVSTATNRVLKHDLEQAKVTRNPETEEEILAHYW